MYNVVNVRVESKYYIVVVARLVWDIIERPQKDKKLNFGGGYMR